MEETCKCENPKPTGKWSIHDDKSWAECRLCGLEYETNLFASNVEDDKLKFEI